jgi:hypothetical protein
MMFRTGRPHDTHTHIHTSCVPRTNIHTHTRTGVRTGSGTHTQTRQFFAREHTYTLVYILAREHTHTQTRTQFRTTHTHTHTHWRSHTHTHTGSPEPRTSATIRLLRWRTPRATFVLLRWRRVRATFVACRWRRLPLRRLSYSAGGMRQMYYEQTLCGLAPVRAVAGPSELRHLSCLYIFLRFYLTGMKIGGIVGMGRTKRENSFSLDCPSRDKEIL